MAVLGQSDNSVNITITTKGDTSGIKNTSDALSRLSGSSDHSGTSFLKMTAAVAAGEAAFHIATTGIKNLASAAISSTSDYEQNRIALETMLGSGQAAGEFLTKLSNFAMKTPFELPEVVNGSKQLLAYGITADKIIPDLNALGNIAAGVGKDKLPFLTLAFGQVSTKGKLAGQEIRQFTEAGVPLVDELAKALGKTKDEIVGMSEDGKISFENVRTALYNMSKEGGRFNNLMEKQSKTFGGTVSNIKDAFGQMLRSAAGMTKTGEIVENGFFDRLKKAADRVYPFILEMSNRSGQAVSDFMDVMSRFGERILDIATRVSDYLTPKLTELWDSIETKLMPTLSRLWHDVIEPLLPILGEALVVAVGAAIDVLREFVDWWSALATAVLDARDQISPVFTWFHDRLEDVKSWFNGLPAPIRQSMTEVKDSILGPIDEAFALINKSFDKLTGKSGGFKTSSIGSTIFNAAVNQIPGLNLIPRAGGGSVAAGGAYAVGDNPDGSWNNTTELFVPNQSGRIMSARDSRAAMGGGSSTTNFNAPIYLTTAEATKEFFRIQDRNSVLASKGLSIVRI